MTGMTTIGRMVAMVMAMPLALVLTEVAQAQDIGLHPPIETSITLPKDEAPHMQIGEWWYLTGHLKGTDPTGGKHEYGFELVTFQVTATAGSPPMYSAHFAVSDITRNKFSFEERAAPGLMSPLANRFDMNTLGFSMGGSMGKYYAKAAHANGDYQVDFKFNNNVPVTLNGVNGIEVDDGFVSPYYSYTSLDTQGTLWDHGVPIKITGVSWYDHEWLNSIPAAKKGWTWFGVSLDDNTQYNLSFLQDATGKVTKSFGVKTENGTYAPISSTQMGLKEIGSWTSPHTGYTYAQRWQVTLPGGTVDITPKIRDQELSAPGHRYYYEGPSAVIGVINGSPVTGKAYAEVNPRGVDFLFSLP